MTPRLTAGTCDICGEPAPIGRHGDPVCTDACATLRTRDRIRDGEARAGLRGVLADTQVIDPKARLRVGRDGFYVDARVRGQRVRIEDREDLDWLTMDLERAVA